MAAFEAGQEPGPGVGDDLACVGAPGVDLAPQADGSLAVDAGDAGVAAPALEDGQRPEPARGGPAAW